MTNAVSRDYSRSAHNRRFIDSGLYLPSIRSEDIDTIAVIIGLGAAPAPRRVLGGVARGSYEIWPENIIVL